jgi:hypothetical protein
MKLGCLLSRNHRKSGLLDLLRVPHPSSAVNSTTTLDFRASGLSGSGLVLLAARRVLRTTRGNWREQGSPTCKHREARASRQKRLRADADAGMGSFREFRMERSGILEAITLVSPVGVGRSMMQAHRSGWDKRVALPCGVPHAHCKTTTLSASPCCGASVPGNPERKRRVLDRVCRLPPGNLPVERPLHLRPLH